MEVKFNKPGKAVNADAYMFLFFEDSDRFKKEIAAIEKLLDVDLQKLRPEDFSGKENNVELVITKDKRIILSGIGESTKSSLEKVRKATAKGIAKVKEYKFKNIAFKILTDKVNGAQKQDILTAQAESCILATYKFDKYKKPKENSQMVLDEVIFFGADYPGAEKALQTGKIYGEAACLARDLGNEPSNIATPEFYADFIKKRGKLRGYDVKVMDVKDIKNMNMGAMYAVAKGSRNEPKFVEMRYNGASAKSKPVVFVGKGVTFDSGGISIKPAGGMEAMKMDMCGAAAVVGAFDAISQLKLKVNLIGLIPFVENMPDGMAFKPGDILTASNGITIEVVNTDAEGRLILADAIAYAERFKPEFMIDLATLTGAAVISLGHVATIAMTNDKGLLQKVIKAADQVYEKVWELPTWEEFDRLIDSDVADVVNTGPSRQAGTITAGMFLKRFVKDYKWVHLDIAGTAISGKATDYVPKYATGVGARLLTQLIRNNF